MGVRGRLAAAALGGGAAAAAYRQLTRTPPGGAERWTRVNHRGEKVTLLEGPAMALAGGVAAATIPNLPRRLRTAGALAALGAGALGAYDDLAGSGASRGLKGHLGALAKGEVTTGAVKVLGIGVAGLAAGALVQRRPLDKLLAGVVIAASANVLNLFDLRPGRAIKVGLISGMPAVVRSGAAGGLTTGALGASAALLPDDLRERSMLGDAGANALGAVLGVAAAASSRRAGLLVRAAALIGLTLASEKVSFTKVIAATPALNALDMLGRRPAPTQPPATKPGDPADSPTPRPDGSPAEQETAKTPGTSGPPTASHGGPPAQPTTSPARRSRSTTTTRATAASRSTAPKRRTASDERSGGN